MRWFCLLLLLPIGAAESIIEDPTGDQEAGFYANHWDDEPEAWSKTENQGWYRYADVESIGLVAETPATLTFAAKFASGDSNDEPQVHAYGIAQMDFLFHDEPWRVEFRQLVDQGSTTARVGPLESFTIGERTEFRMRTAAFVDAVDVDGSWQAEFSKTEFLDTQQLPMRAGDSLTEFAARGKSAHNYYVSPCATNDAPNCWKVRDLISGTGSFDITQDAPGVGHILANSEAPYRGSNGVATTYLYNVTVRNIGDQDDRITVQIGEQPKDWEIRAPATVRVAAGEEEFVPVAVTVPFVHKHGDKELFEVRLSSEAEPGIEASVELGVIWHEVPQPGGHHPDIYLHGGGSYLWFNTLKVDPEDDRDGRGRPNSYSTYSGLEGSEYDLNYNAYLRPDLLMGLDFENGGKLTGTSTFESPAAISGDASLEFALLSADGAKELAAATQAFAFTEGENQLDWEVALSEVDRIPFKPGNSLRLTVGLAYAQDLDPTTMAEGNELPILILEETSYRLPLQDYHDLIDEDLVSSLSHLSLRAQGESTKELNPGRTAVFPFTLHNAGPSSTIDWHLEGATEWAAITPAATQVGKGGEATVLVTVAAPDNARDGDVVEVLLVGTTRDSELEVFGRVIATVVTGKDIPDEADLAAQLADEAGKDRAKSTPAPALMLALLAALLLRRR